jgi:hypothetical protein
MKDDLKTIPGIKEAAEAILANDLEGGPVRTTFELVWIFVSLRRNDMSNNDHYHAFVRWLCRKGVAQFKHDIAAAIAGKLILVLIIFHLRAENNIEENVD